MSGNRIERVIVMPKAKSDEKGTKVFYASYDAWGVSRRKRSTPLGLHCGCMGHEMLNEFNLINMNGRVYDFSTR